MEPTPPSGLVVAAVFDAEEDAVQALEALREAGVQPDQVSLMMSDRSGAATAEGDAGAQVAGGAASGATMGGLVGGLAGWLLGIGALAIPGVGPVLGAGVLGSLLAGAAIGAAAGGLLGGLVSLGIPEEEARTYESHVRAGRVLLTVHAADVGAAEHLRDLLETHGAYDVRIYEGDAAPVAPAPAAPGPGPSPDDAAPPASVLAAEPAGYTFINSVDSVPEADEPAEPAEAPWAEPAASEGSGKASGTLILNARPNSVEERKPALPAGDRGGGGETPAARDLGPGAAEGGAAADPQVGEETATPYRSGGEAARSADLAAVRALAPEVGDRGLEGPATPAGPDLGPSGTETEYRSGGAGSRGEDMHG